MKKNNQNNLKKLKEIIKTFIIKYVTKKANNVVKSSKIHHYFSILNDINISSHSFFPLFLNTYEELFGDKLVTKALKFKKGEPFVRCVLGIHLELVPDHVIYNALNSTVISEEHINQIVNDTMIQKNTSETIGELKTMHQTVNGNVDSVTRSDSSSENNNINLDLYMSYFELGNEEYSSKFLFDLYKIVYKNSPKHLNYIISTNRFTPIFKEECYKKFPKDSLNFDVRLRVNGHSLRGIRGLKKIKD